MATPFPIGGKMHHINQSQNYMAMHSIWLLRKRSKLWEGKRQKRDSISVSDTEFGELRDL